MAKVKNKLHQPLELDFGKTVYRFKARQTLTVDDKFLSHKQFKLNEKDLLVLKEKPTKAPTKKAEKK